MIISSPLNVARGLVDDYSTADGQAVETLLPRLPRTGDHATGGLGQRGFLAGRCPPQCGGQLVGGRLAFTAKGLDCSSFSSGVVSWRRVFGGEAGQCEGGDQEAEVAQGDVVEA